MGRPRRRCIPGALWHCCCSCTWQLTQQGLREREDSSYFLDSKIVKKRKQQEFTRFLYSFVVKVSWNRESTPFPKAAKGYKRRLMMDRNCLKQETRHFPLSRRRSSATYNQNLEAVFLSMAIFTQWQLSLQGTLACYLSIQLPGISQTQIWISHCILPCFPLHRLWAFLPGSARMTKPTFVVKAQRLIQHTVFILHLLFSSYCSVLQCWSWRTPWALGVNIILESIRISFHTDNTARSYNGNKCPWLEVTGEPGWGSEEIPAGATPATPTVLETRAGWGGISKVEIWLLKDCVRSGVGFFKVKK